MHLGQRAQPVIAEAKLREQAAAELARFGAAPVNDPLAELARLAGQVTAWKDSMGELVNELGRRIRYEDYRGSEQLRAEVALFERALDRCSNILTAMARLDIDARLTGIREATADGLVAALETALAATGLAIEDQWRVRDIFREGVVLLHPLTQDPEVTQNDVVEAEIRQLENRPGWLPAK